MEPLWSPVVPTGGNQRQRRGPQTAKTTEIRCDGCDRLHETFHGKEGVDGSSPSEGFTKRPANGLFRCLDGLRTSLGSASLNLSPGSVPNIARALEAWLKQRRLTSSSTSMNGRYPGTEGRKDIDASDTRRSTV
jgi:hypothetical protein